MALYNTVVGGLPQATDVNQITDIFSGKHDLGAVTFAPQLSAPSTSSFSLAAQAGTTLGVGTYGYEFTYITGYYKSDGTLNKTGETVASAVLSITTAASNTTVKITLPTTGLPTSAVAIGIYRTAVGGSTYGLIATVKVGNANYTDSTSDANRGAGTPPVANTTGTILNTPATPAYTVTANGPATLAANVETLVSYNGIDFVNGVFTAPMAGTYLFNAVVYTNVNNGSLILHPYLNGVLKGEPYKFTSTVATTWDHVMIATMVFTMVKGDILKWWATSTCSTGSNLNSANSFCTVVKVS